MNGTPQSAKLHPGIGYRIRMDFERLDQEQMDKFREFESPDISDQLNRMYSLAPEIQCLTASHHQLVGPTCTAKVFPGDNLMVHKVLDIAKPKDIVVIDAGASAMNAVLGGIISTKAKSRGIAGFIVDGYIRDLPEILALDFPVFARGTSAVGPLHRGPGEINYPIVCGGRVINPGDIIVADQAGVVVVPHEHAPETCQRMIDFQTRSRDYVNAVKRGEFSNEWVDEILKATGCVIFDGSERS